MTRDDIIRMAREAGLLPHPENIVYQDPMFEGRIKTFAALVAAAAVRETSAEYRLGWNDGAMMEREACAKVCEELDAWNEDDPGSSAAVAIRARGQE
jgi:hypothetical protein